MTEARKLAVQPQMAFLRRMTASASSSASAADCCDPEDYVGCGGGSGETDYDSYGGDGEDSGYTEIPMVDGGGFSGSGSGGLRDRVARFVFRSRSAAQPQPAPPPPPVSAESRRRCIPAAAEFPGYAYTRWTFQQSATTTQPVKTAAAAATSSPKSRTVRFRCPYDDGSAAPAAGGGASGGCGGDASPLVQPYSISALACPVPHSGDRSASSGYGSDMDAASSTAASPGCGSSGGDHWAVREEDIDRLLFGARTRAQPPQPLRLPTEEAADLDVKSLDVAAFFSPPPPMDEAAESAIQIDRVVVDALRSSRATGRSLSAVRRLADCPSSPMNAARSGAGSPWLRQQQQLRGVDATAAAAATAAAGDCYELADMRPGHATPHSSGLAYYYQ